MYFTCLQPHSSVSVSENKREGPNKASRSREGEDQAGRQYDDLGSGSNNSEALWIFKNQGMTMVSFVFENTTTESRGRSSCGHGEGFKR